MAAIRRWVDPFIVALVVVMVAGLIIPVPAGVRQVVDAVADVAVTVLFLVYGMRLRTRDVWDGLRNARLQGAILASTYVVFPAVGLVASGLLRPAIGSGLADGVMYLSLLPSTVQSSVAFTSVARGNVAGAICGATVSNMVGMVATPLLVLGLMSVPESAGIGGVGGVRTVLLQLLVPFAIGQALQPWCGDWIRARRWLTSVVDRGTILLVVFGGVGAASAAGVWAGISWGAGVLLVVASCLILAVMLGATWWGGALLHLPVGDRIALLLCGSKKSLATGLPMASALLAAPVAGAVAVPVIVFHQIQLIVCAVLARHLARHGAPEPSRGVGQ